MDAADKVLGEEEEEEEDEEKEHFFTDLPPRLAPAGGDGDEDEDLDAAADGDGAAIDADAVTSTSTGGASLPPSGATVGPSAGAAAVAASAGGTAAVGEQERRAQVGASPYLAPFTPLSSPSRPKTPSSASVAQRAGRGGKPQLVPVKSGAAPFAGGGTASRAPKDDVVAHLPPELVEALLTTVQTLDKLVAGVEDFRAEQLGFLADRAAQYVELLRKVDAAAQGYDALIPLQVLEYDVIYESAGWLMVCDPLTIDVTVCMCDTERWTRSSRTRSCSPRHSWRRARTRARARPARPRCCASSRRRSRPGCRTRRRLRLPLI